MGAAWWYQVVIYLCIVLCVVIWRCIYNCVVFNFVGYKIDGVWCFTLIGMFMLYVCFSVVRFFSLNISH